MLLSACLTEFGISIASGDEDAKQTYLLLKEYDEKTVSTFIKILEINMPDGLVEAWLFLTKDAFLSLLRTMCLY